MINKFEKIPSSENDNDEKIEQLSLGDAEAKPEIKIESAGKGAEMTKEIIDDILKSLPDEKHLSSTFLLRIKQGSLVNALELSQQMSMLVDLKLLQEKI